MTAARNRNIPIRYTVMRTILFAAAVLLVSSGSLAVRTAPVSAALAAPVEDAMRAFWEADSPNEAETRAAKVVAAGGAFDEVLSRLKSGRPYGAERSGRVELPTTVRLQHLDNVAEVPAEYTPSTRWALRVSLHGGVGREAPRAGDPVRPLANRIPGGPEIVLHPRAWAETEWWKKDAVDNLLTLVDRLKRRFNIDERRIYITGISDGGTGVYFFGMRSATAWAACLPLNGHPSVLANPDTGVDGELFSGNLVNCPLHAVNGGRDRLYPAASVAPLIEMFKKGGIPVSWQVYPEANHDTSWWPEERARYEAFLLAHPRVAHPDTVSWETERTDRDDDVADRQLQERHVARVRRRGHADERERARFGRDNREADRPPRRRSIRQKVVARRLLELREPGTEERDGDEVTEDDGVVEGPEDHAPGQSNSGRP